MATIPAARPSKPSIRVTALVRGKTHAAVINGRIEGPSTTKPAKGSFTWYVVQPLNYSTDAASTCPATFAGALISRKSSSRPTTKITPAAISTPNISCDDVITARSGEMATTSTTT